MAIDKNSKAYQALQKSGYTDEQITQMHGATSSWQSAQQVIQANTPQNTPERATTTYQNQWAGNYVFNEKTGYYENTSNLPKGFYIQNITCTCTFYWMSSIYLRKIS